MQNILILTNIAPNYRKPLWLKLLQTDSFNCSFAYGENLSIGIPQIRMKEFENSSKSNQIQRLKNIWLKNIILFWQLGALAIILKSDYSVVVFLGECYCLSTWLSAIICRLKGARVVFWGHGIYGNESRLKLFLRKNFYRLAHQHLVYGRRAKRLMIALGFKAEDLFVVFNSLDYDRHKAMREQYRTLTKQEVYPFFRNQCLPILLFIGRLTISKRLDILLHAANSINSKKPFLNLVVIGDGPEREKLEKLGQKGIAGKWLHFVGACYLEEKNGRYLSVSDLCVSPGNVGLTAIHSLSFGTPVCTHSNLNNQGPEAEAIVDGYNGFYFKENDVADLIEGIKKWLLINPDRELVRERCFRIIDAYYNPDYQLSVFNRMVSS
ncbi:MAG: glycosyltransferase family 4 protein [Desulfobacterales bacterium]|jgi:glycosyltransferase involved in cell wall biosynthesis|nr:glycosyltransferase family 4 protein [Desulfobacterales bacterium]